MNTKLTLSIEKEVILKAKQFAKKEGRSLSNIIEEYLKFLTKAKRKPKPKVKFHPLTEELCGSIKMLKGNLDYDEVIRKSIVDKFLKQ